jgi:Dolichyl-phosphate-mannose--protein O-mannosyl transferase
VAMLPLLYLFAKKIFRDWRFASITSLLMMFDFMHFTQTRIATIDVYGTFFIIAMYYYMYDTFMIKSYNIPYRLSVKPLFLCGLMFGLGVASKWIAAYGGAGLALIFFTTKYLEYRDYKKLSLSSELNKQEWHKGFVSKHIVLTMFLCVLFFIIIPCTIYYLSYIPYMEVPGAKKGLDLVMSYQKQMFEYHSKLKATHAFSSPWYEWPIIYKPTWFYSGSDVAKGYASTIVTMGNPAIWWTGIPAFFTAVYVAYKKKDKKMALIFAAIVFQYMPWVLVPRITWIYHYFSTVPFIIICIVYVMKELYERNTISKKTIFIYLTICAVLFIWFYPALSGLEVPQAYIYSLRWFYSWIF